MCISCKNLFRNWVELVKERGKKNIMVVRQHDALFSKHGAMQLNALFAEQLAASKLIYNATDPYNCRRD